MSLCTDSQMFFESSQIMLENIIIGFDTNLCSLCYLSAAAGKANTNQTILDINIF